LSDFSVIRNREGGEMILLDEHDMATTLAGHDLAQCFKDLHDFPSTERWKTGQMTSTSRISIVKGKPRSERTARQRAMASRMFSRDSSLVVP